MSSLKCKEVLCIIYACVLFLSGTILVGFSAVLAYKLFCYFIFVPTNTVGPFALIFILGFAHILLTWLAVKGPSREHDFHIITFMVFSVILIVAEVGEGIWSMVLRGRVATTSEALLNETFDEYIKSGYNNNEWIRLEKNLHCCGPIGVASYSTKKAVPFSCYNTTITESNAKVYIQGGCTLPFVKYMKNLILQVALAGFICAIYQVLGILAFYSFYTSLKEERIVRSEIRASRRRQSVNAHNSNNPPATIATAPHS